MAIFVRAKNSLSSRLESITTLQRFNHFLTQETRLHTAMLTSDAQQSSTIDFSKWKKINANAVGVKRSMIPPYSWLVLNTLHSKGFEAYLVGGCVRDLLLNRIPKDFDVITTATLKQVRKRFHRCEIVGRRYPICRVHVKDSIVEVSSFRTVAQHSEIKETALLSQRPSGCDEKDFIRWRNSMHRDFTINSFFFDPFKNQIFDYANGMADLSSLKLRTLIPAQLSFQEDCARILRGLRIAGRLGLSISKETEVAICKLSSSVKSLDKSRIMMELNYMLSYGAAESTIYLLRRFNMLELFLPFHAAYLNQHAGETSSRGSMMLMKLFFNLDKLVSCDQPCHCSLWVGLLAFHQALVTDPQEALVIWVFASVLYHGNWKEGVKFARPNAKMQVNFSPEISGFSDFNSDEELAEKVSHFATLVRDSVGAFLNQDILAQFMFRYGVSMSSGLVFVTKKVGHDAAQLFDVLMNDVESYNIERKSSMIDYFLLGKGNQHETRYVFGKIIWETLGGGLARVEFAEEGRKVIEEQHDPELSDLVKDHPEKWKNKKSIHVSFDHEHEQRTRKKQKLSETKCFSQQEVATEKDEMALKDKSQVMTKKPWKMVETAQSHERELNTMNLLERKRHHLHEKSEFNNSSIEEKVKHEENKDCHEIKHLKQMLVKEKSCRPSLSSLFRR